MRNTMMRCVAILAVAGLTAATASAATGPIQHARAGGGTLVLSFQEAYPLNLDAPSADGALQVRTSFRELVRFKGDTVEIVRSAEGGWEVAARYHHGSDVLAVAESPVKGRLLVLDAAGLSVVDYLSFDEPAAIGRFPLANRGLERGGHYIERFGSYAYVLDAERGGFVVLDVESANAIIETSRFTSASRVNEIRLHEGVVYLLSSSGLQAIDVGWFLAPQPRLAGTVPALTGTQTMSIRDGVAYVADGAMLRLISVESDQDRFLQPLGSSRMPGRIEQVVSSAGGTYIVDVTGAVQLVELAR